MWSKERKKKQRENSESGRVVQPKIPEQKVLTANLKQVPPSSANNNAGATKQNITPSKPFQGIIPPVKPQEHLPPPPPLPSLLGGASSLGIVAGKPHENIHPQKPPNESRPPPNFTNRGIMNPTGLNPPKKVEKLSDYSSDLKPAAAGGSTLSADVKLNHFISKSKPVNSVNPTGGVKWPT